jgi:pimeloyl-ACP methyl ester carboxylesterase
MRFVLWLAGLAVVLYAALCGEALIYFGGNGEDVVTALDAFSKTFPDHAMYLVDYRGYGGSTGKPSEDAIQADAAAVFDRVRREHADIALIGRSLGSGVAIRLAAQRPAKRLVLVTPYDSIVELAAAQFPFVPVHWLLIDRYESFRYAPAITVATTLVMADRDEVIPRASTERLFSRFKPGIAVLRVIEGAGHNTISNKPEYLDILGAALR